ncbi:MAG: hypothetical protein ACYC3W_02460 [Candidatus Nanopelagicales bacterium]
MQNSSKSVAQLEQLALFEGLPSPALLRAELATALLEHRDDDASRGLQDLLDTGHPDGPAFAAVLQTLAAIRSIQGRPDAGQRDAVQAVALMEGLVQQLRALVGEHVDSFARTLWAALAVQFAHLQFSKDTFKAHAGWLHLQAGDVRLAWAAFEGVDAAQVSREAVEAVVRAGFDAGGASYGWSPLCWHAWRWPEATRSLIDRIGDADISALARAFTCDCDLTMDWFPAWAITQESGLGVFLRRSVGGRESELRSSAQQCAVAAYDLVIAELGGSCVTEKRMRLLAMDAWVYGEYMRTVRQSAR